MLRWTGSGLKAHRFCPPGHEVVGICRVLDQSAVPLTDAGRANFGLATASNGSSIVALTVDGQLPTTAGSRARLVAPPSSIEIRPRD